MEKGTWIHGSEAPVRMSSLCALWDEAAVLEEPRTALVQGGGKKQPEQGCAAWTARQSRETGEYHDFTELKAIKHQ